MGFWNKLGKIALQAAPYVAAPFTGGASLMATGATQKLGQKWAESDAKKAIAKGLAPSKFDKILGGISTGAGLASSLGMGGAITGLSKAGAAANAARAAGTASKVSGFQNTLGKLGQGASIAMGAAPRGVGTEQVQGGGNQGGLGGWQGQVASIAGDLIRGAGNSSQNQPVPPTNGVASPANQLPGPSVRPNLGNSIFAGRQEALMNQPWRAGYQTHIQGPEEGQVITADMPPVYPNFTPPIQSPPANESGGGSESGSIFADHLTPNYPTPRARRRNPEEE